MKLLLLGATGKLGEQVMLQSLDRGHHVTVLVRSPKKIAHQHARLTILQGDALDSSGVASALSGQDAVISSLGLGNGLKSNNFIEKSTAVLLPAMQAQGIKLLIFVSAFGVGKSVEQANFLQRMFFKLLLADMYADKVNGDNMIEQSNLDWTIVKPVKLTNGKPTHKQTAAEKLPMRGLPSISRSDVAEWMLTELEHPAWIRKSVVLK